MTFFFDFVLYLILSKIWGICKRDHLFFFIIALHLILGGNLDICGRDDLFFALHFILGRMWTCRIAKWVAEYRRLRTTDLEFQDFKKIYFKAGKTMQANTNESISAHTLPV